MPLRKKSVHSPKTPRVFEKNDNLELRRQLSLSASRSASFQSPKETDKPVKDDIPIWFSVFFGSLNPVKPRLDHVRFDAKISEKVFESQSLQPDETDEGDSETVPYLPTSIIVPSSPPNSQLPSPTDGPVSPGGKNLESQLFKMTSPGNIYVFTAIVAVSQSFERHVFARLKDKRCTVCQAKQATALIKRPLGATRDGYVDSKSFLCMRSLMNGIAGYTAHLKTDEQVDWAIGGLISDRPYLCILAIPICSPRTECHRIAAQNTTTMIYDLLTKPFRETAAPDTSKSSLESENEGKSPIHTQINEPVDLKTQSAPQTPVSQTSASPASTIQPSNGTGKFGVTTFIGRPTIPIKSHCSTPGHQLSCVVSHSEWPHWALPNEHKDESDDVVDYCRVVGHNETSILSAAHYRCAICPEINLARSLVHLPLAYIPKGAGPGKDHATYRPLIMELFHRVAGRWTFPETEHAKGQQASHRNDCHIFDFVVPVCAGDSTCAVVARVAARLFIQEILKGLRLRRDGGQKNKNKNKTVMVLPFHGLNPYTDLGSSVSFDSHVEPSSVVHVVRKISSVGLVNSPPVQQMVESIHSGAMNITMLRRMEIHRKRVGELVLEDDNHTVDNEANANANANANVNPNEVEDEEAIYIFQRDERNTATPSAADQRRLRDIQNLVSGKLFFQPMATWDYYMVLEALQQQARYSR